MTVFEYRQKLPKCIYCYHQIPPFELFETCKATGKTVFPWTAKKCPCFRPNKWESEIWEENDEIRRNNNSI